MSGKGGLTIAFEQATPGILDLRSPSLRFVGPSSDGSASGGQHFRRIVFCTSQPAFSRAGVMNFLQMSRSDRSVLATMNASSRPSTGSTTATWPGATGCLVPAAQAPASCGRQRGIQAGSGRGHPRHRPA